METSKAPYSSAKVSRACIVFWIHIVGAVICVSVLFICCAETSFSTVEEAVKFSQPRSFSILLRCKRQCGITGHGCLRDAHSVIPVTALDDLNLCHSRNLGCSLVVLGRVTWLAVLPLTGPVTVRMVAASGPSSTPSNRSSCVASREEPSPSCTRRTLDHNPACSQTCLNTEQMYIGQQTVCPRTEMACAITIICNRESQETCAHTFVTVSMCCTLPECKSVRQGAGTQNGVSDEDT